MANLQAGQTYTMPQETLGYEWDSDVDNGFRPPGEIDMSKTCENVSQALLTVNEEIGPANECNSLTLYKAASGALVFDAGTVQWAWGLNNNHDGDANGTNPAMQQATVNLFAMMGVQPATLMSGLVPGTAAADTSPPTSTITSPSAGATFANGSTVTISGTATAAGGRSGGRRGVHRRRLDLASCNHDVRRQCQRDLELHLVGSWQWLGDDHVARD